MTKPTSVGSFLFFFETTGHKWILLSWKISIIWPYKLETVNTKTSLERNIASLPNARFGWNQVNNESESKEEEFKFIKKRLLSLVE